MIPASSNDLDIRLQCDYISGSAGKIFVTSFVPQLPGETRRVVLCLSPFAEEMNKARRMMSLQCQLLARNGVTCILPDVYGTGDSEGRFLDGGWRLWNEDISAVWGWLKGKGVRSLDLLAVRSGIYLAEDWLREHDSACGSIVLWSPTPSGGKMINRLLRTQFLKARGQGQPSTGMPEEGVEVAGYQFGTELINATKSLRLADITIPSRACITWFEISLSQSDSIGSTTSTVINEWREKGLSVQYRKLNGRPFWIGPEIEIVPELLSSTVEVFCSQSEYAYRT